MNRRLARCGGLLALVVSLAAGLAGADAWDPGDDMGAGGTSLSPTATAQVHGPHTINATGDFDDWFKVSMVAGRIYHFDSIGGTGDNYGAIYSDAAGFYFLDYDDDTGGNSQFSLDFSCTATGTYYFSISTWGGSWSGSLNYWWFLPPPTDAWDPADDTGTGATLITPTLAAQAHGPHTINLVSDFSDWYAIPVVAGRTYHFDTVGGSGSDYGVLYGDASGITFLGSDFGSGAGGQFSLDYAASSPGTVYLNIAALSVWSGSLTYSYAPTPASLAGSLTVNPSVPAVGQWVDVVFSVANTGGGDAAGVVPDLSVVAGMANVVLVGGPAPAGPVTITPLSSQSFTWTFSVSGSGPVSLSATAAGTDVGSGSPIATAASTGFPRRRILLFGPEAAGMAAALTGMDTVIWDAPTWATKNAADFAAFDAIYFGNPGGSEAAWNAPITNRAVWSSVITGNKIVVGGDPIDHGQAQFVLQAVTYAAEDAIPGPGLFVELGDYAPFTPSTIQLLLSLGTFTTRDSGCWDAVHKVAVHPVLSGMTDASLSNWGCSTHSGFDTWPAGFQVLALAPGASTPFPYSACDGSVGMVWLLATGTIPICAVPVIHLAVDPAGPVCSQDTLTYRVSWSNAGGNSMLNLTITDSLPAGVKYLAPSLVFSPVPDSGGTPVLVSTAWAATPAGPWTVGEPPNGTAGPFALRWVVDRVASTYSGSLTFATTLDLAVPAGTLLPSGAWATIFNDAASVRSETVTSVREEVRLDKSASVAMAVAGNAVTYTLGYVNCTTTAYTVRIWDTIPAGATFVAASNGGTLAGGIVSWAIPQLDTYQTGSVSFTVSVTGATSVVGPNIAGLGHLNSLMVARPVQWSNTVTLDVAKPVLAATKSAVPSIARTGDTVVYELQVVNSGTDTATAITVTDTLPAGAQFLSATGGVWDGVKVVWTPPDLGPGGVEMVSVSVVITSTGWPVGPNTAPAAYANSAGYPQPVAVSNPVTVSLIRPVLGVAKSVAPPLSSVGGVVTYTITVANTGADTAANLSVWDTVPVGADFVAAGGGGVFDGTTVAWALTTVPPGTSVSVSFSVTINGAVFPVGPNVAFAACTNSLGAVQPGVPSNGVLVTERKPVITLAKAALPSAVAVGGPFLYTLVVSNTGTDTAANLAVWDSLPPGATFTSASAGGVYDGTKVDWTLPDLPAGGSLSVTVYAVFSSTGAPVGPNTAWVSNTNAAGWSRTETASNGVMVTQLQAVLEVGKWADRDLVPVAGSITWTVTVTSSGSDTAMNVTVWDSPPAGVLLAGCTGGTGCTVAGGLVTWPVANLPPGAVAVLTVSGTASAAMACPNIAQADYANSSLVAQPTASSTPVCAVPVQAVMTLVKTTPKGVYAAGEPIVYTLAYANTGTDTATNVMIWDTWTANAAVQSVTGAGVVQPGGRWAVWTLPSVPPGSTGFVGVTLTWTQAGCPVGEQVQDLAAMDYFNSANIQQGREVSGWVVDIENAGLVLTLTPSGWSVSQGDPVTFFLGYANPCNDTAWNVSLAGVLPAGMVFLAATGGGTATGWVVPSIAPGASGIFATTVSITGGGQVGPMVFQGIFLNGGGILLPAVPSNSVWISSRAPALTVVKDSPAEAVTQESITFTLLVTNIGLDTAIGVTLVDTLPPPLRFVSGSNGATAVGRIVTWNLGSLPAGGSIEVTVTAHGPDEELEYALTNVGMVTYASPAGIGEPPSAGQRSFLLHPRLVVRVYPNPYDAATAVGGTLKFAGLAPGAAVRIFTLSGVLIREVIAGANYRAEWDGRNIDGAAVAQGAYLYAIEIRDKAGKSTWIKGKIGVVR